MLRSCITAALRELIYVSEAEMYGWTSRARGSSSEVARIISKRRLKTASWKAHKSAAEGLSEAFCRLAKTPVGLGGERVQEGVLLGFLQHEAKKRRSPVGRTPKSPRVFIIFKGSEVPESNKQVPNTL